MRQRERKGGGGACTCVFSVCAFGNTILEAPGFVVRDSDEC